MFSQKCILSVRITGIAWLVVLAIVLSLVNGARAAETETRVLKLGVRKDCPPFSFFDDQSEIYRGYSVDLCSEIARNALAFMDYRKMEFIVVTAQDRFRKLADGEIDILCEATTVTQERLRVFGPTIYTFVSGASIMYSDAAFSAPEPTVGVLRGTTTENAARSILRRQTVIIRDNIYDFKFQAADTYPASHWESLNRFREEKIHVYIADREILLALNQKAAQENREFDQEQRYGDQEDKENLPKKLKLTVAKNYYTVEPYALFLRQDDHQLRYISNRTLSDIFKDDIHKIFRNNFPNSRMNESLRQLFRLQQLLPGVDPLAETENASGKAD